MKKVLIVTPRSPFQGRGADEQDRLSGIKWFISKGWGVRVVTKVYPGDMAHIERARMDLGIPITTVAYKSNRNLRTIARRLRSPLYLDGAAYEYFDPEIQEAVASECASLRPDVVWFDYTYLWPLYHIARSAGARIVTRSINYEPLHFLDEEGRWPWNYVRVLPKLASERMALRGSDYFLAISPNEERIYRRIGATPVKTLPLRSLPIRLERRPKAVEATETICLGFMPSTYTVRHNLKAFRFVVEGVWPRLPASIQSGIRLHVTGNKFPDSLRENLPSEVVYDGFVPDSAEFWLGIDIALAPSLFGAGMQQKVFEPMALGIPTITSARGLAGYPFICGRSVLCADTADQWVAAIVRLAKDGALRKAVGESARNVTENLFSQSTIDSIIEKALE